MGVKISVCTLWGSENTFNTPSVETIQGNEVNSITVNDLMTYV